MRSHRPVSAALKNRGIRPQLAACCLTALMAPGQAVQAMGLGNAQTLSNLGESLLVVIPLTATDDWRSDQIKITVTDASFELAREIDATLEPSASGHQVLLHTDATISEPYINFTLQLRWPAGNLRREYQILLDPAPTR